ncbi:MAG: DCC1-like thiol-disulfide oxidoreductase family protein [Gemmatimonadaceae bacterium]
MLPREVFARGSDEPRAAPEEWRAVMTWWQGAAAIEEIVRALPKGRLVSWMFAIPFARPIADRFYRWFARHRRQLGCGSHCAYRPQQSDFPD